MDSPLPFRFAVAFSLAGSNRDKVLKIADLVAAKLGRDKVFYDDWYEHEILGPNMDVVLQRKYSQQSLMVVACLSQDYADRQWCQAEADAINAFRMTLNAARDEISRLRLLYIRFGPGDIPGVLITSGYLDGVTKTPEQCGDLILKRYNRLITSMSPIPAPGVSVPIIPPSYDEKAQVPSKTLQEPGNPSSSQPHVKKQFIFMLSLIAALLVGLVLSCNYYYNATKGAYQDTPTPSSFTYAPSPAQPGVINRISILVNKTDTFAITYRAKLRPVFENMGFQWQEPPSWTVTSSPGQTEIRCARPQDRRLADEVQRALREKFRIPATIDPQYHPDAGAGYIQVSLSIGALH